MPGTADEWGVDPFDEDASRDTARAILDQHLRKYGDLETALMAYHAGAGNVDKHLAGKKSGVGPLTKSYPGKVFAAAGRSRPVMTDAAPEEELLESGALGMAAGASYSSDDDDSSLGGATELDFTLADLDEDAVKRSAKLRAAAVAAGQKIPIGAGGWESSNPQDRDPTADLESARSVRDLLVPQSTTDIGLAAAMGPGRVPVRAGLGALGMAVDAWDADAALGPGMSKRFFSPLVELIRNLDVKKPLPEKAWRELLTPDPKTGKTARFRDARTGLDHPVTPDEWEFARGDAILGKLGKSKPGQNSETLIGKDELADLLESEYPGLDTKELGGPRPAYDAVRETERQTASTLEETAQRILRDEPTRNIYDHPDYVAAFNAHDDAQRASRYARQGSSPPQYSEYTLKGPRTEGSYQESLTKYERGDPNVGKLHYELYDENTGTVFHPDEPRLSYFTSRSAAQNAFDEMSPEDAAGLVVRPVPSQRTARRRWQLFDEAGNAHGQGFNSRAEALEELRGYEPQRRAELHPGELPDSDVEDFIPRAGHFQNEPNFIAHSRAGQRTTVDGLKARHVDEFQSDHHQQARDEGGYAGSDVPVAELEAADRAVQETRRAAEDGARRYQDLQGETNAAEVRGDLITASQRRQELERVEDDNTRLGGAYNLARQHFNNLRGRVSQSNRPPPAPLRKNWHEVELKKQLAQAIEDGDDVLTWTTGEQQIERYKSALRQQVDKIDWVRRPDGKYDITPMKGGRPVNSSSARSKLEGLTDRELEDTIGTEMAKKIRESKGHQPLTQAEIDEMEHLGNLPIAEQGDNFRANKNRYSELDTRYRATVGTSTTGQSIAERLGVRGTLTGDDLTVGGAGMRSFYDRDVVETAKKLAKKYGGEYVKTELPNEGSKVSPWTQDGAWPFYHSGLRTQDNETGLYSRLYNKVEAIAARNYTDGLSLKADDLFSQLDEFDAAIDDKDIGAFTRALINLKNMLTAADRGDIEALFLTNNPPHEVHAIRITPKMREMLAKTGGKFSLYADGGAVLELPWEARMAGGGRVRQSVLRALSDWYGTNVREGSIRTLTDPDVDNWARHIGESTKITPEEVKRHIPNLRELELRLDPDALEDEILDLRQSGYSKRDAFSEVAHRVGLKPAELNRLHEELNGEPFAARAKRYDEFMSNPDAAAAVDSLMQAVGKSDAEQDAAIEAALERVKGKKPMADGGSIDLPWEVNMAGGGEVMRALLRRLGLAKETPVMRKMGEEELVRPFAGEASTERQVVDELENPGRRELLFGRARPEMRTEADSTRNLPALREPDQLPALRDEAQLPVDPSAGELLGALEQATRYEPSRRHFMQGAASLASMPKRFELLSETVPELVTEVAKPKLVLPRKKVIDALSDILSEHWDVYADPDKSGFTRAPGNVWGGGDANPLENVDALVAKRLNVPVETLHEHFDAPSMSHYSGALEDPGQWIHASAKDGDISSVKQLVGEMASSVDLKPKEYKKLIKRLHGFDIEDEIREAMSIYDYRDGGAVEMADGGSVRKLTAAMRRWLNELGGLPVSELPEEAYKIIEKSAPKGEKVLYHGTYSKPPFKPRKGEDGLFLTRSPGVAEAFSDDSTGWHKFKRSSTGLVTPFTAPLENVPFVSVDEFGHDTARYALQKLARERLDQSLFKLENVDDVPVSKRLLDNRSGEFIENTYNETPDYLRDLYDAGHADSDLVWSIYNKHGDAIYDYPTRKQAETVLRRMQSRGLDAGFTIKQAAPDVDAVMTSVQHDQYFAPRAGSLRRWNRGGSI